MIEAIQLDLGWEFWLDEACGETLDGSRAEFTPVPIPHDWMIWRKNLYEDGTGWYRYRLRYASRSGERTALFLRACIWTRRSS